MTDELEGLDTYSVWVTTLKKTGYGLHRPKTVAKLSSQGRAGTHNRNRSEDGLPLGQ